jgi:hypothetical protein
VAEEGLLISYHSNEQGICTWEPAFAVRIHLSYLSPDRLAATSIPMWAWAISSIRNFPMLARFSVIPRQLRQSNSPNIIQSGFTCDRLAVFIACNWDVHTVWVPTGWLTEPHLSTLASRQLLFSLLPPTTFSLSPAPQTSSIPNGGIDHQPECSETAPRARCSQQGPKSD